MKLHKNLVTFNKILINFVVFVIVPSVLFILITSRSSYLFGIRSFDVLTGSMEPTIHVGSMVFTKPEITYQVGDIITFKRRDITITHRIASISNNTFQTKGDANKTSDQEKLYKGSIIGKDIIVIPFLGRITNFIKTPLGFILIMGIPTFLFISFEIYEIKNEIIRQTEERIKKEYETNNA